MAAMAERGNNKTADAAAGKEQTNVSAPPAPKRKFWMQSSKGGVELGANLISRLATP
jgi:hypothetical protein